jgi:predicted O-methyltransferase YrrM
MSTKSITGPLYDVAYSVLQSYDEYRRFREGKLTRTDYAAFLDRIALALTEAGLPADDVHFAKRYPRSEVTFVAESLADLVDREILNSESYDSELYEEIHSAAQRGFHHGSFKTYIYPEEARLLFAIADIAKPRAAIFLGSYYGYWAHAAIATIARHGGRVVLVDPDERAQNVARINLDSSQYRQAVEVVVMTGEDYLNETDERFDFVVLDAEMPRTHHDPEQRGKRVYASLLRHSLAHLAPHSLLVCHNILFQDRTGCPFFNQVIWRNRDELGEFMKLIRREFPNFVEYISTEGVGVGSRLN